MNKTNITHYFFHLGYCGAAKNKLQTKANEYLESLNGNLIDAQELEPVKKEVIDTFQKLNAEFPNCRPLKISFWPGNGVFKQGQYVLSGYDGITFSILPATQSHHTTFQYFSPSHN